MSDVWMMLNPREVESVMVKLTDTATGTNVDLLRAIQTKVQQLGPDAELTLKSQELALVRAAHDHWKGGYSAAFKAILSAAARHGH